MNHATNVYLYEIIEDYKTAATPEEQELIVKDFMTLLWSCPNPRRIYHKSIRFTVRKDLLDTEIGRIFQDYTSMAYKGCKSRTKKADSIRILRQKINNLYTRYFDPEIILSPAYMKLLKTPKQLYLAWLSGAEFSPEELTGRLRYAVGEAERQKAFFRKQKMNLSWNDYKKLMESYLTRCFKNCCLADDYEKPSAAIPSVDFASEDNFYLKYFHRSLEGYLKDYQRAYYGLRRKRHASYTRCVICGAMIEKTGSRKKYCSSCAALQKKLQNRSYRKKEENRKSA